MLNENLIKIYQEKFRENRDLPAISDYFKDETYSYFALSEEVAKLHLLFQHAGVEKGDKIALIGRNNPKWCICYIASITYGAVIVPILQDFASSDVIHIINHSESKLLFIGDMFWDNIEPEQIPSVQTSFSLTDYSVIHEQDGDKIACFQGSLNKHFRAAYPDGFGVNDIKYPELPNDHVCLLNYTSGTTGSSKGVILTINNLTGNVVSALGFVNPETGEPYFPREGRALSFLPLAHAYGCAFDFLTQLAAGGHVTLLGRIPSPKILLEAMKNVRPTVVNCVPLILEKVYRKQIMPLLEKGPMSIAVKIPLLNSAIYSAIKSKLLDGFGGEVKLFIVGGAPINLETESFLMKIGFPITVGYGMTECAPLISFTEHTYFKSASCGKALAEMLTVKIDSPDPENTPGEIMVKGEHVMKGYYKNEEATKAVLDKDGWLHTGDMGVMDADGTIYIRGRSKTMILSASGQNIYPEEIENKLNNLYLVNESLVLESGNTLAAMVVPDYELAEADGISKDELPQIMEQNLKELNTMVSAYEKISSIIIYPIEFEKTPKKSIKRYLYNTDKLTTLKES